MKQNINIGIIGHFGGNKYFTDGQTVKTKEVEKAINSRIKNKVNRYDTYKNSRNIFKLILGIKKILKENDVIIFLLSSRGYKIILPLLIFFNKFYKKKIYDFVIGSRYKVYEKNKQLIKFANKLDKIYVETEKLKNKYNEIGIPNVSILPNFKDLKIYSDIPEFENKNKLKICTFTRVCKEKGIEDAINAVKEANKKLEKDIFYLDIYGQIDKNYVDKFEEIRRNFPKNITYKGIVDPEKSSDIIKDYDVMLFLTYWDGEAFPGTVIDSLSAGVPVIATDWNCNFEVLKENYTGIKTEIKNPEFAGDLLVKYYKEQKIIYDMKKNCIEESYKYIPENIIDIFFDDIE